VSEHDQVVAGCEAWQRLHEHGRRCWANWLHFSRALAIGRPAALKAAESNAPVGSKYNAAMGSWLRENGLDGITQQARYRLLLCMENLQAIETWRAGLDEATRAKYGHPDSIWFAWRRDTICR